MQTLSPGLKQSVTILPSNITTLYSLGPSEAAYTQLIVERNLAYALFGKGSDYSDICTIISSDFTWKEPEGRAIEPASELGQGNNPVFSTREYKAFVELLLVTIDLTGRLLTPEAATGQFVMTARKLAETEPELEQLVLLGESLVEPDLLAWSQFLIYWLKNIRSFERQRTLALLERLISSYLEPQAKKYQPSIFYRLFRRFLDENLLDMVRSAGLELKYLSE
ncbi:MAG TPA: hypothetical protein VH186_17260 [Chloroflexia bacterium]|nr:hypothetical protein [Chloroflexia bacterium]